MAVPLIRGAMPLLGGLSLCSLTVSGCGMVFQGTMQTVRIDSTPKGAHATLSGQPIVTPGQLSVRRREWTVLRVSKEGYQPVCRLVGAPRNVLLALLDSVPLGLGWLVDKPTDALRTFPHELHVELEPLSLGVLAQPLPSDEVVLFQWRYHATNLCAPAAVKGGRQ